MAPWARARLRVCLWTIGQCGMRGAMLRHPPFRLGSVHALLRGASSVPAVRVLVPGGSADFDL